MLDLKKINAMDFTRYNLLFAQSGKGKVTEPTQKAKELISNLSLEKTVQILIILLSVYIVFYVTSKVVNQVSEKISRKWRLPLKKIIPFCRMLILMSGMVIVINILLKSSPQNFITLTGTIIIALGFILQDYFSSVVAGIINLLETSYQIGDRVQIGKYYGEIVSYGLRNFSIQTIDDDIIIVPHNKIWTEAIVNSNSSELSSQIVTTFYFDHNIDIQLVRHILYMLAYTSKYTQLKLPIVVYIEEMPWGTCFKLQSYTIDLRSELNYKTDLITRAKRAFSQHDFSYPKANLQYSANK